jgi:hypothetical protein
LIKWELHGPVITQWLVADSSYVHPVKFDGKVLCFAGVKPKIHAVAAFETLHAKYDKRQGSLQLKFRTYMAGSGNPDEGMFSTY